MHKSKVLQLLKTFSKEEMRLFRKFVHSPFYNYSPAMIGLYDILRKYHPEFDSPKLDRKKIFEKLYPEEAFQDKKMRNTLREFTALIEGFLVAMKIRGDRYLEKKLLTQEYGDRNLYDLFERGTKELLGELEGHSNNISSSYQEAMQLYEALYFHSLTKKHTTDLNLIESISENLSNFNTAMKLRLICEIRSRESVLSKRYNVESLELREDEKIESRPLFTIYALLIKLFEEEEDASFQDAKRRYIEFENTFPNGDRSYLFQCLLNYAIRKGNSGSEAYLKENFDLYKIGLASGVLFSRGKMTDATYTNIAALGIKIGEFDWVKTFIEEYEFTLDDKIRINAKTLSLSFWYYAQGNFDEVDKLISNHHFTSVFYHLRARLLLLRANFESFLKDESYYDLLMSNILAFEKYLRRNTLIGKNNTLSHLGFIQFLKQVALLIIRRKTENKNILNITKRIEQAEFVINRNWLLEKIRMLKKR